MKEDATKYGLGQWCKKWNSVFNPSLSWLFNEIWAQLLLCHEDKDEDYMTMIAIDGKIYDLPKYS